MRRTGSTTTSRPTATKRRDALALLEGAAGTREVDLKAVIVRRSTGETLFEVGGRWDSIDERWLDEPPRRCKRFLINEAQLEPAIAVGEWIAARRDNLPRVVELVFDGARGSGKTHLGELSVWWIAVAFPGARCWLISPANTRRFELEQIASDHIPLPWRRAWSERDSTYRLPNGSTVAYVSAGDEDALKQGGYEVALMNEAQLITSTAYAAAAGGVRNLSGRPKGLLILAMNYAAKARGEWTTDHLEMIEAGTVNAQHFKMDPRLNISIDTTVVDDVDALIRSVRPDLADVDALGIRRRLGDMAAPAFKPIPVEKGGHVGVVPDIGFVDIARSLTAKKVGREKGWPVLVGTDFQKRPHCAGLATRIYQRGDGKNVYNPFDVILTPGTETDLAARIIERGHDPDVALVIADSSGKYQNVERSRNGLYSHDILRSYGFAVVPPTRQRDPRGTTGVGRNPDVEDSLSQLYDVCEEGRLIVDPSCEWLIEALRRCKVKYLSGSARLDDSRPGYSHIVDCLRYVIWWAEPRRAPKLAAPTLSGRALGGRRI